MAHTLIDAVRGDRTASYAAAQENKRDLEEHAFRSNRLTHEYEELFTFIRAALDFGRRDACCARWRRYWNAPATRTNGPPPTPTVRSPGRCWRMLDGRLEDALTLLAAAGRGHRALLLSSRPHRRG